MVRVLLVVQKLFGGSCSDATELLGACQVVRGSIESCSLFVVWCKVVVMVLSMLARVLLSVKWQKC